MFYGQYTIQIDNDKSISFPEHFSDRLRGNVFVIQGFDRNLIIMPEAVFKELYQRVISLNMADPLARLLLRLVLGNALLVKLDDTQKMQLSESLFSYADLSNEVGAVLVGQGDHVEVWSRSLWDKQSIDIDDAVTNSYRFASLNLSI